MEGRRKATLAKGKKEVRRWLCLNGTVLSWRLLGGGNVLFIALAVKQIKGNDEDEVKDYVVQIVEVIAKVKSGFFTSSHLSELVESFEEAKASKSDSVGITVWGYPEELIKPGPMTDIPGDSLTKKDNFTWILHLWRIEDIIRNRQEEKEQETGEDEDCLTHGQKCKQCCLLCHGEDGYIPCAFHLVRLLPILPFPPPLEDEELNTQQDILSNKKDAGERGKRRKRSLRYNKLERGKKARAAEFCDWLIENLRIVGLQPQLKGHEWILDVAGGKGDVAWEFAMKHSLRCAVVDPRPIRLSAFKTKQLISMASKERQQQPQPQHPQQTQQVLSWLDAGVRESHGEEASERAVGYLYDRIEQQQCLFDEAFCLGSNNPETGAVWIRCSLVIGMHPDEATEAIVDECLRYKKPFAVVPCCVFPTLFPHRTIPGKPDKMVREYEDFIEYLKAKDPGIALHTLSNVPGRNIVLYKFNY